MSERIEIWTDGGCLGNPGPGGWAYVCQSPGGSEERSGFAPLTTNNKMELNAVLEALKDVSAHPQWNALPITVKTDSQYVQKGITEWIKAWARNGWKTSAKKPVKNVELWQAIWELVQPRQIQWVWVVGHAGIEMNERCDELVQIAIKAGLKQAG